MRLNTSTLTNPSQIIEEKIEKLLSRSECNSIGLKEIWTLMDEIWDSIGCDNRNIDEQKLSTFYRHPVWLLNGLFVEHHEVSMQHRRAIADWVNTNNNKISSVIDFGGGFGTIARLIATYNKDIVVDIYEPHPNHIAIEKTKMYTNVKFINTIMNQYDCLVCTDVLEHVSDPLCLLLEMIDSVNIGGYLIISNCFYPVIKCHLPRTFHLRYTFNIFTKIMGLDSINTCENSFAIIYKKTEQITDKTILLRRVRRLEIISKFLFPLIRMTDLIYRFIKNIFVFKLSVSNLD